MSTTRAASGRGPYVRAPRGCLWLAVAIPLLASGAEHPLDPGEGSGHSHYTYHYTGAGALASVSVTGPLSRLWSYAATAGGAMRSRALALAGISVRIEAPAAPLEIGRLANYRLRVYRDPLAGAATSARLVLSAPVRFGPATITGTSAGTASISCPALGAECRFDLPARGQWHEVQVSLYPRDQGILTVEVDGPLVPGISVPSEEAIRAPVDPADRDADGMLDGWELAHGLDPLYAPDALDDPDRDGKSNRQEFAAGSHPGRNEVVLGWALGALAQAGRHWGPPGAGTRTLYLLLAGLGSVR